MYIDKKINCSDCKQDFVFTVSEQKFYAEKGFKNEPKKCKSCRNAAKLKKASGGRGGSFSSRRTMYKAVCDECGKTAEVPFKPSGDKPVYCRDCFSKNKRV